MALFSSIRPLFFIVGFLILSLMNSCGNGDNNPIFNCPDGDCSKLPGQLQTQIIQPLDLAPMKEQAYWYSRYNLGSLVMKSGLGETFKPDSDRVKEMIAMAADNSTTPKPASKPALLKRVFNTGNPQWINQNDGIANNFENFRWAKSDDTPTTAAAFGWTLMKEVEWSKLFNVDLHFGTPDGKPLIEGAAQQRFSGLVLCAEAVMQITEYIENEDAFDNSNVSEQIVALAAISNMTKYIETERGPLMADNRCRKVAAKLLDLDSDEVVDEYFAYIEEELYPAIEPRLKELKGLKEKAAAVQNLIWYGSVTQGKIVLDKITQIVKGKKDATKSIFAIEAEKAKTATEKAAAIKGLIDLYRVTDDELLLNEAITIYLELQADFDQANAIFKSQNTYTTDDVAIILSAFNALRFYASKAEALQGEGKGYLLMKTFSTVFESLVNKSGLQIAAPPVKALPKWEQKASILHRANNIPVPPKAGGENGTAPVFASSVTFKDGKWAAEKSFDTAGAMHLANEMIWFHNSEVSGYPCLAINQLECVEAIQIDFTPPAPLPPTGGGSDANGVTFTQVYDKIIKTKCLACHHSGHRFLKMHTKLDAYKNLLATSAGGAPRPRVEPGNEAPDASFLIAKLIANPKYRRKAPERMPQGGSLSNDEIELIKSWIKAGANNN